MRRILLTALVAGAASMAVAPGAHASRYTPYYVVDAENGRVYAGVRDNGANVVSAGVSTQDPNACVAIATGWPFCVIPD